MIHGSNVYPPQVVTLTSPNPFLAHRRSVYRPYGPLQGLGQVPGETPIWLDVNWWGKTLATAGFTFGGLYVLAKL